MIATPWVQFEKRNATLNGFLFWNSQNSAWGAGGRLFSSDSPLRQPPFLCHAKAHVEDTPFLIQTLLVRVHRKIKQSIIHVFSIASIYRVYHSVSIVNCIGSCAGEVLVNTTPVAGFPGFECPRLSNAAS